jgi:hypothetical protein
MIQKYTIILEWANETLKGHPARLKIADNAAVFVDLVHCRKRVQERFFQDLRSTPRAGRVEQVVNGVFPPFTEYVEIV